MDMNELEEMMIIGCLEDDRKKDDRKKDDSESKDSDEED